MPHDQTSLAFRVERRLPVLFTVVLAILLIGLTWTAYREVRSAALHGTRARLVRVTGQLVDLLSASVQQLSTNMQEIGERPEIRAFLRAPLRGSRQEALDALRQTGQSPNVLAVELWHPDGTRALTTARDPSPPVPEAARALIATADSTPTFGPIRQQHDSLAYSIILALHDRGQPLGYLVQTRRVSGSQGGRQLAQLIGSDAVLFFGNAAGDLWTDFSARVDPPPIDIPNARGIVAYERAEGGGYLAAPTAIPRTPWVVMVEFPLRPVLAPSRAFLLRTGTIALALIAAAAIGAWALSRYMTGLRRQVVTRTRALQDSESRLRSVTETAHDAIISADARGVIRYWNPGASRMFGYQTDEAVGQPLTMLMPEKYRGPHATGIRRYGETREPRVVGRTVELEGRRRDGTVFPIELSLAATQDEALSFTGVIRDITERKRIEAALHATNAELESFSYSVSHDLRAPLRAIHGFARILQEDHAAQLDAEAKRLLGVIDDNTRRMGLLIDDLLAFSRLGRKALERTRVDMRELVRASVEDVRRAEGKRQLDITIAPDLPPAAGDRELLRQAVANLLQNAAKFTRHAERPSIEIGHQPDGDHTVYYVKDNGAGFDQRYAGKLFGVFQRLHRADEFEGTGVGLAIVQRIVQRHGGRVWAEGKVNEGATFYLTLPPAPEE